MGSLEFWQTQKMLGYSFTCALYQVAQKKAGTRVPSTLTSQSLSSASRVPLFYSVTSIIMYMKFMSPLDDAYLCIWKVECVLSLTETLSLSAAAAVFLCHVRR